MHNFRFSGHETFICKQLWPKKGYDFLAKGKKFSDLDAVVDLGVGKNMVNSIRFWLKAMNLIDEGDRITKIAKILFNDKGYDPYIEDIGTIWLLHYLLVSSSYATIYNIVFNDFFKIKNEFSQDSLIDYIKRLSINKSGESFNKNTISSDIKVLLKNYLQSEVSLNSEDDNSGILQELGLITRLEQREKKQYYSVRREDRPYLPKEIFLFAILLNKQVGENVTLNELVSGNNSVGNIFLMSRNGIYTKIEELTDSFSFVSFSKTAGVPLLQFEKKPDPLMILEKYYENINIHTFN